MKHVTSGFLFLGLVLSLPLFADSSCECPKLACDPCSVQKSIKFFSEKCGPSDAKVKSCARPLCVPVDEASKECPVPPVAGSGPRPPVVVKEEVATEAVDGKNEVAAAGRVKVIQGSVSIVHADGQKSVVTKDAKANDEIVREGDVIESGKEGGAVVHFNGGNKLHVSPETTVQVKEFREQQSETSRKAMLNLIRGKIRNQVDQKYNGKTSYYRITTRGAVAGVRGTDFVIEHHEGAKMETRVETLEGRVVMMNRDETESRSVGKGEGAVYIAPMPTGLDDDIVRGKLSETYPLNGVRMVELDRETRMDVIRTPKRNAAAALPDADICEKPKAKLNQCSWKCENNPTGEKTCRTDLTDVRCVRQRCNANGSWADESRLPAATSQTVCPAAGALVKDCDY